MPSLVVVAGMVSVLAQACPTDSLFRAYEGEIPGASITVVKAGNIIYEDAFGLANCKTGEPATPTTNYRLASVTKQFTATAILMLEQRGKLSINDRIVKYLPELAKIAPKVTIKHLLTHTSGLPQYEKLIPRGQTEQVVDKDVLDLVAKQKMVAHPGRYLYNNTGYALLALIVERVSTLSYTEFLERNIFKPLGMTSTVTYKADETIPNRAYGYSGYDEDFKPSDQSLSSAVLGDGGIYSSTHELARWIGALDNSTLLKPTLLAQATSMKVHTTRRGVDYGYGWRISDERGEKLVWHTFPPLLI